MVPSISNRSPLRTNWVRKVLLASFLVLALFIDSITPLNGNRKHISDRLLSTFPVITTKNDDTTIGQQNKIVTRQSRQTLGDSRRLQYDSNNQLINSNVFERNPLLPESRQGSSPTTTASNCTLNANGFFGQPTGQVYEIQYIYQTTVVSGTSPTEVLNNIAPALDIAIPNSTIPYLFPQCNNNSNGINNQTTANNTTTRSRLLLRNRRLQSTTPTIDAISSLPEDQFIMSGCKCNQLPFSKIGGLEF